MIAPQKTNNLSTRSSSKFKTPNPPKTPSTALLISRHSAWQVNNYIPQPRNSNFSTNHKHAMETK